MAFDSSLLWEANSNILIYSLFGIKHGLYLLIYITLYVKA